MKAIILILSFTCAIFSFSQVDSIYYNFQSAEKNPLAVKELFINDFKGKSIPSSVGKMKNLEVLVLKNSSITSIPSFIGRLEKLTVLSFWNSKISKISDSISNLANLERLEIVGAYITSVDSSICKLSKLTNLNFLGNKISFVSPSISNLKNLKMLTITNWDGKLLIDNEARLMLKEAFEGKCFISGLREGG